MSLTLRSASTTTATTKAAALTHAEMDANWLHVSQSANTEFVQSGTGASAETVQDVLRYSAYSVRSFGVTPSATAAVNTTNMVLAIAAAVAAGRALVVPDGTYPITQIVVISGLTLILSRGARFSFEGTTTPKVTQTAFGTKVTDVWIEGGSWGAATSSDTGRIFQLYGDDITIKNTLVDGVYGSASGSYVIGGDRITMLAPKAVNVEDGVGRAGIRFFGGNDFICSDAYIEAGDDVFQFVPVAPSGGTNNDQSIRRGKYVNCVGYSASARLMAVGQVDASATLGMTANITDCAFIGCSGRGGDRAIVVTNEDSTGYIRRIKFIGCDITMSGKTTSSSNEIFVGADAGTGGVEDIYFIGGSIMDIAKAAFGTVGNSLTKGVRFSDFVFDKPSTSGTQNIVLNGIDDVVFDRCTFKGADGTNVISMGATENCEDVRFRDCTFIEIENTRYGAVFTNVTGFQMSGCVFEEQSGQTTARAINVGASSSNGLITGNNVSLLSITAANRIVQTTASADIKIKDNIGWNFEEGVVTTNVGNVGGGTDNLQTYTLLANTLLEDGKGVRITAWGTTANNANPKTVALLFGTATIATQAMTISEAGFWHITATVIRTATDAQDWSSLLTGAPTVICKPSSGTSTEDDGAAITIKCTGTVTDGGGGINNDDIVQQGMHVAFIN